MRGRPPAPFQMPPPSEGAQRGLGRAAVRHQPGARPVPSSVPGAPQPPLLLPLLTLCSACPPDSCDRGLLAVAVASSSHNPWPPSPAPLGVQAKRKRQGMCPCGGTSGHAVTSILCPFAPMAFLIVCTSPPARGEKVRVQGCLTWMWPPTRVNNYRITSIFIAFLLR